MSDTPRYDMLRVFNGNCTYYYPVQMLEYLKEREGTDCFFYSAVCQDIDVLQNTFGRFACFSPGQIGQLEVMDVYTNIFPPTLDMINDYVSRGFLHPKARVFEVDNIASIMGMPRLCHAVRSSPQTVPASDESCSSSTTSDQ